MLGRHCTSHLHFCFYVKYVMLFKVVIDVHIFFSLITLPCYVLFCVAAAIFPVITYSICCMLLRYDCTIILNTILKSSELYIVHEAINHMTQCECQALKDSMRKINSSTSTTHCVQPWFKEHHVAVKLLSTIIFACMI